MTCLVSMPGLRTLSATLRRIGCCWGLHCDGPMNCPTSYGIRLYIVNYRGDFSYPDRGADPNSLRNNLTQE
jgi:hypothetical protein